MLSTNSKITSAMPVSMAAMVMDMKRAGQLSGHERQRELPRDMLRPGWQDPHSNPVRLKAHCASAPLGWLRSTDVDRLIGIQ